MFADFDEQKGVSTVSRALLIGVGNYDNLPPLASTHTDVARLATALSSDYQVRTLIDPSATEAMHTLRSWLNEPNQDDDSPLLLYYAGHGLIEHSGDVVLTTRDTSPDHPYINGLLRSQVEGMLRLSASRARVLILDCCYSGATSRLPTLDQPDEPAALRQAVLTSTTAHQPAYWDPHGSTSLFTGALIEGLSGAADSDHDGVVTLKDLYNYTEHALRKVGIEQTPTLTASHEVSRLPIRRLPKIVAYVPQRPLRPPMTRSRSTPRSLLNAFTDGVGSIFDVTGSSTARSHSRRPSEALRILSSPPPTQPNGGDQS